MIPSGCEVAVAQYSGPACRMPAAHRLQPSRVMRSASDNSYLEDMFSILRFRKRTLVSFRRFVILNAWQRREAHELQDPAGSTQPMRAF